MRSVAIILVLAALTLPAAAASIPGPDIVVAADDTLSVPPCEGQAEESRALLAQRGCCSWHGGICGCSDSRVVCCDGQFSPSCTCNNGTPQPTPSSRLE